MTNQAQIEEAELALTAQCAKLSATRKASAMNQVLVRELCRQVTRIMSAKDGFELARSVEAANAYAVELQDIFGENLMPLVAVAQSINTQVRAGEKAWS